MLPKVEISAKPTGPQLHAPAAAPIKEPNTPPPIFLAEFFKILILKIFIGNTKPERAEIITIKEKPNSVPFGM